ncbi:hypothetical protein [Streptomyces sp. NPDC005989]|uniref:hypothetical protein n=1 Tax=Streptomyces sp. NPDC005989 TaxID=3156727 RepID=UPI0033EFD802
MNAGPVDAGPGGRLHTCAVPLGAQKAVDGRNEEFPLEHKAARGVQAVVTLRGHALEA